MNNPQDPVTYLYDQVSLNPQAWRSSACQFKRAANLVLFQIDEDGKDKRSIVQKPISLDSVYAYLMSVAMENLLKGILIAQNQPFEKVVSFNHDLVELYNECNRSCGLTPKKVERRVLQVLAHFATWAGRFNLPKRKEDFSNAFSKHGLNLAYGIIITPLLSGKPSEERLSMPSERKKIEALYQRLLNHLDDSLARSGKPNRFPCGGVFLKQAGELMRFVGKSKIGRLSAYKGKIYPQIRLPSHLADTIGQVADVFETEYDGNERFCL